MLKNFEIETAELSETELSLLPFLIKGFKRHDENSPITAPVIVKELNKFFVNEHIDQQMTQVKLRKFVNFIRTKSLLPLIATSEGYYVSGDKKVIELQIKSLQQRANSIHACAVGLQKFIA